MSVFKEIGMYIIKLSTNKYRATLSKTVNGKRKRYTKTFTTSKKKDAAKMAQEWESTIMCKVSTDCSISELLDVVWSTVIKNKSPNTVDGYTLCKERIVKTLDDIPARDLSPRIIQHWIDKLSNSEIKSTSRNKRTYSPKTIKETYFVLSRCFSVAVAWELLPSSPCHDIVLPINNKKEAHILSPNDLSLFINGLDTLPLDSKVLFELALFCSLRRGEILGIKDEPIGSKIVIDKARYRTKDGIDFVKEPKTKSGIRICSIPDFVKSDIENLRNYHNDEKKRLRSAWINSSYLIKAADGSPIAPHAVGQRLTRYAKKIGIDHVTFHQLRHTYASIVASSGTDLVTLSQLMGHSNKSTTLSIYTHLFKDEAEVGRNVANMFDGMIQSMTKSHE